MKTYITFSYGIGITNFLAHWKSCFKTYVIKHLLEVKKRLFSCIMVFHDDLGFVSLYMVK